MGISGYAIEHAVSEAMQLIAALPEDDERLKYDSLEGETRFFAVLDDLAEASLADSRLIELARERIKRLEERATRRRSIIVRMLEIVDLKKAERPLYTASIAHRAKAIITEEALLPPSLMRISPDMHAIAKALKEGPVLGAEMSNPQPVLTLRTS